MQRRTEQQSCSKYNDIYADDVNGSYIEKVVDDITVYYLILRDRQSIIWKYDGYDFILDCPADLDWETITQMVTSIAPQE